MSRPSVLLLTLVLVGLHGFSMPATAQPAPSAAATEAAVARLCPTTRDRDTRGYVESQLNKVHWDVLPTTISPEDFNDAAKRSLQSAENDVYHLTFVEREELKLALRRSVKIVQQHLTLVGGTLFGTHAEGVRNRDVLTERLGQAELIYGREYVVRVADSLRASGSTRRDEILTAIGYNALHNVCGGVGMEPAAFAVRASQTGGPQLILCPGLLLSMKGLFDSTPGRRSQKDYLQEAVMYVMGRELGRAIRDAALASGHAVAPAAAEALTPEYWGGVVLAERLKDADTFDRWRVATLAMDTYCHVRTPASGHEHAGTMTPEQARQALLRAVSSRPLARVLGF